MQVSSILSQNTGYRKNVSEMIYFVLSETNKKASIRWQDSARRPFKAGLIGDVGL